jgi:hypothetical protein
MLLPTEEPPVQGKVKERWRELCEQAAIEQDPIKLSTLVAEIDRLLEEKQSRLNHPDRRRDEGNQSFYSK